MPLHTFSATEQDSFYSEILAVSLSGCCSDFKNSCLHLM